MCLRGASLLEGASKRKPVLDVRDVNTQPPPLSTKVVEVRGRVDASRYRRKASELMQGRHDRRGHRLGRSFGTHTTMSPRLAGEGNSLAWLDAWTGLHGLGAWYRGATALEMVRREGGTRAAPRHLAISPTPLHGVAAQQHLGRWTPAGSHPHTGECSGSASSARRWRSARRHRRTRGREARVADWRCPACPASTSRNREARVLHLFPRFFRGKTFGFFFLLRRNYTWRMASE